MPVRSSSGQIETRFADLLAIYCAELLERVVLFWAEHAIDLRHGGTLTCIAEHGPELRTASNAGPNDWTWRVT